MQKEKLQELDQVKSNFFNNITHELRTPLTLIVSPLEELVRQPSLPPPALIKHQHHVIYQNAQRLLRLINQLLDAAKLEAGSMTSVKSRGDIGLFVQHIIESFHLQSDKKQVSIQFNQHTIAEEYLFDAEKLEKIVFNLLSNALKFTPAGGTVDIDLLCTKTANDRNLLHLKVADTGSGIAAEELPFIFNRFYQAKNSEYFEGSGLGLFLVKELTAVLGGDIKAESALGQGTTFTVTLPLYKANGLAPAARSGPPPVIANDDTADVAALDAELHPQPDENAPLVLIVEDHEELRSFIAVGLKDKYRVLTAADGKEGWRLTNLELPDLVITDVAMPEMDGFTLSRLIKETPLTTHIAVILLTAKASAENRIQGLYTGANDYLVKPFNLQELHLRMANLVSYQQKLREYWRQRFSRPEAKEITGDMKEPVADDPFLVAVNGAMERELENSAFTVEQLAGEMAVSARTLHRKLSALTGMNPAELMRSYRLSKAAIFLQKGFSVSEVTYRTGFESLSYFSKCFKLQFSVTPSAYANTDGKKDKKN